MRLTQAIYKFRHASDTFTIRYSILSALTFFLLFSFIFVNISSDIILTLTYIAHLQHGCFCQSILLKVLQIVQDIMCFFSEPRPGYANNIIFSCLAHKSELVYFSCRLWSLRWHIKGVQKVPDRMNNNQIITLSS